MDKYVSTVAGDGAFMGNRSIVIHFANKTRIACANFMDYTNATAGANVSTSTNGSSTASASGSSTRSGSSASGSATGSSGSKTSGSASSSSSAAASTGAASQIFANSALVGLVGGIALFAL